MTSSFLVYLVVGKVLMFFSMKFAKDNGITKGFMGRLLACGACLGFYIYSLLSLLLGEYIFSEFFYVPVLSQIVTGAISSLFVHLLELGWREQFGVITVE